jgi:hypothetical protein
MSVNNSTDTVEIGLPCGIPGLHDLLELDILSPRIIMMNCTVKHIAVGCWILLFR